MGVSEHEAAELESPEDLGTGDSSLPRISPVHSSALACDQRCPDSTAAAANPAGVALQGCEGEVDGKGPKRFLLADLEVVQGGSDRHPIVVLVV